MAGDPSHAIVSDAPEASPGEPVGDSLFRELTARVRAARPQEDLQPLENAYFYAAECHKGQKRHSGEPYITHPLHVALILADMNMDTVSLQTGLLHDVMEDTNTDLGELTKRFGKDVAHCVNGVTKLTKLQLHSAEERQAESVRKMLLAMVTDIRVIIVKLADRLHNMRTLDSLPPDRQRKIAEETLEIYAPIAHRLGMGKVRGELEDLGFAYLEPEAFAEIKKGIETRRQASQDRLDQLLDRVSSELRREGIPARVEGRIKRPYSVYLKIKRQKISLDNVFDLLALRIVTDSVKNCYAALGIIHNEWRPIPGRIKDFIAIPRPNLYQSLHTSVIGPGGQPFEVQIRTDEMHRIAEEGIAAHWKYKEGHRGPGDDDHRVAWLRQMLDWQSDVENPIEFLSNLKVDLYPEEVYTFTPRGKVIVLPRGAGPLDFAYAIHTDVGHSCVGCKVNGRIVPLKYVFRNGDVVEILTQPGHMPSKDWLAIVKTARARNRIKQVVNQNERAKALELGQKLLEKEARRMGVSLSKISRAELEEVASSYGFSKSEDLQSALGYGKIAAKTILQRFAHTPAEPEKPEPAKSGQQAPPQSRLGRGNDLAIRVKGVDDILVYRARCCNPIRGENIVGYITRGKGIAVHSETCNSVRNLLLEAERRIEVEWERSLLESFAVKMMVYTDDRPGLLNDLTSVLSGEHSNIRSLEARSDAKRGGGEAAVVDMTVDVRDKRQLERIVAAIRRIPGVRDVERV